MTHSQHEVASIQNLDALFMVWQNDKTDVNWAVYQEALNKHRSSSLETFWKKQSPLFTPVGDNRIRLHEALTMDPARKPTDVVERWLEMVVEVQRRAGTLTARIELLSRAVEERYNVRSNV